MKKIFCLVCAVAVFFVSCAHAAMREPGSIKLGVVKFNARSEGVTDKQAEAIGDIFSSILANSKSILVVERNRLGDIKETNLASALQATGCDYILTGAVTKLESKVSIEDFWLVKSKKEEVTATIDIRIIDARTTEVPMSFSESGTASAAGSGINIIGINTAVKEFSGLEEAAILEAVSRAGFKIRGAFASEYARILDPGGKNKDIAVNAGKDWGIDAGNLLCVYSEGEEILDIDGSTKGRRLTPVAIVSVNSVQDDLCFAQIYGKKGVKYSNISRGNIVQPITEKEADNLIKKNFSGKKSKSKSKSKS